MLVTLALAASIASFPGGSTGDLAVSVAKATGRNVFLTQAVVQPIKKFDYETKSYNDLTFDIRTHANLHLVTGQDLILEDTILPPMRMPGLGVAQGPQPTWKSLEADNISNGAVTFSTAGNERLDPASLAEAKFSKPVTVNWMLGKYGVAVSVSKLPEKTFLSDIAQSVGGKLVDDKAGYRLDLDPEGFRTRVLNLLGAKPAEKTNNPALVRQDEEHYLLLESVIRTVDAASLEKAFRDPGAATDFNADGSSSLAGDIAQSLSATGQARPRGRVLEVKTQNGLAFLDARTQLVVTLKSDFTGSIAVQAVDARGRPKTFELPFSP
ncbi:MAG TPA: hypothetical protein VMI31_11510 [Fimbriimonadaceae bacterium]|nr:hypothetical protein [Fimbriimonadaceae bacterium]